MRSASPFQSPGCLSTPNTAAYGYFHPGVSPELPFLQPGLQDFRHSRHEGDARASPRCQQPRTHTQIPTNLTRHLQDVGADGGFASHAPGQQPSCHEPHVRHQEPGRLFHVPTKPKREHDPAEISGQPDSRAAHVPGRRITCFRYRPLTKTRRNSHNPNTKQEHSVCAFRTRHPRAFQGPRCRAQPCLAENHSVLL